MDAHVQQYFRVWDVKTQELGDQTVLPELLPFLDAAMDGISFNRTASEEGYILFFNLPTAGVLSAAKENYVHQLMTNFLAIKRVNGVAVVIMPNRAGAPSPRT